MKNGFYISAYCCIDEEGCCLNAQIRHDQSIALWKVINTQVYLVKYWELERYTRKKQHMRPFLDKRHFLVVLNDLLSEVNLSDKDIIAIWGMPDFDDSYSEKTFAKKYKLPLHSIFHVFSSLINTKKLFTGTHLIFALDGGPDNVIDKGFDLPNHYCAALFEKGKITTIESISSPAYLWAEASEKFSMREGTLMALAEACNCNCDDVIMNFESFKGMWDIPLLRKEFEYVWSIIEEKELAYDNRFSEKENRISCFMKIVQKASRQMVEKEILNILNKYSISPHETVLSLVGGFALNCPTNTWIMDNIGFKEFLSPPCVNDSGIALGMGLLNFYLHFGINLDFDLKHAFWGHRENDKTYEFVIRKYNKYIKTISEFNINRFICDIDEAPVCWFEAESEIGPRALGHRSILSSAQSIDMKEKLNKIKQREWWRPVAPIVLDSVVNEWFEPPILSPYMLHAVKVVSSKRKNIPAVLHLNDTARIQTINKDSTFYEILLAYYKTTGIPMICNTSLNDKGEPIISTFEELFNFALRKKIHIIYIDKKRIELHNYSEFYEYTPHKTNNCFDSYLENKDSIFRKYLGVQIDDEDIDFFVNHRELFGGSILWMDKSNQKNQIKQIKEMLYENLSS